jgi:hypothetical protein
MAWFREKRDAGVRVTGKAMQAEALRLHKENGSQSFVFNFSISVLLPENVYVHGTSSPMLKNLSPVTVTFMFPPRLKK